MKCRHRRNRGIAVSVAPLAGARIEIHAGQHSFFAPAVAPLAGARIEIEIPQGRVIATPTKSLPSRERGLKYIPDQVRL